MAFSVVTVSSTVVVCHHRALMCKVYNDEHIVLYKRGDFNRVVYGCRYIHMYVRIYVPLTSLSFNLSAPYFVWKH